MKWMLIAEMEQCGWKIKWNGQEKAPPQLDLAPELDDAGFEASAPPPNETDSCEAPRSEHMAGREAIEFGPFWLLLI